MAKFDEKNKKALLKARPSMADATDGELAFLWSQLSQETREQYLKAAGGKGKTNG
tara:strand:+ start:9249 stop:9413 length:165 start_codon:yes stop_codon:yes gene_type:complete